MKEQKVRPFGIRDKLGYALGDCGCNFSFQLVSTYMLLFYTQCVGLKTTDWAWIIIVAKVWDAINDVLIGNMVDHIHIGKKSKFMPWITIGGVSLVVTTILLFAPFTASFAYIGKVIWCLLMYCLWSVAYTLVNVPYGSLHSVITEEPKERTSLSTFRSIGASLPAMICMVLPKLVYRKTADGDVLDTNRVFITSIVFSLVAVVAFMGLQKLVTERVVRVSAPVEDGTSKKKTNYLGSVKSYFTNRALIGITIATVALVVFYNSTMSMNNLVFQYFFGDAGKATIGMVCGYIPLLLFMPFASTLSAKFGKKVVSWATAIFSCAVGVLMLVGCFTGVISPDTKGMIIYIVGLMFVNIGCCCFQIIVWAMVADCIEMNFRKTGKQEEGTLYAIYSFFRKLSQGIGSAMLALFLGAIGYVEGQGAQTEQFKANVPTLYIGFLVAGLAIMFVGMFFVYNIDKKKELEFAGEQSA
ncbi:MAG: MFS transporter [Candidatus Fimenecus sp.]